MINVGSWGETARRWAEAPLGRYGIAAAMVLAIAGFRAAFDAGLGSGAYYILYYPAFVLTAYLFGAGPVVLAIAIAVTLSYFVFIDPDERGDPATLVRMALYVLSSSTVAFFVLQVRKRLGALSRDLANVSALTRSQANLFREHAEQVSNHMQLTAALLEHNSHEVVLEESARVLRGAASRAMLISRAHRDISNPDKQPVDFGAFAERLAETALESLNRPPLSIAVEGKLEVPSELATSLALVLLECISARTRQQPRGVMTVVLAEQGGQGSLTITEDVSSEQMHERDLFLLGALAEQVQGRLVLGANDKRGVLRLAFPTGALPSPVWAPPMTLTPQTPLN